MEVYILRKGDGWTLNPWRPERRAPADSPMALNGHTEQRRATDLFRKIAHQHGSRAVWLPQTGMLVTQSEAERHREYPYEEWRDWAVKETVGEKMPHSAGPATDWGQE